MIPDEHAVLVLYGDVPLITAETLRNGRRRRCGRSRLLTVDCPTTRPATAASCARPAGRRGSSRRRTPRPSSGRSAEVNTGIIAAPAGDLRRLAGGVSSSDNAQGEFYLTDIVALAVAGGTAVEHRGRGERRGSARA